MIVVDIVPSNFGQKSKVRLLPITKIILTIVVIFAGLGIYAVKTPAFNKDTSNQLNTETYNVENVKGESTLLIEPQSEDLEIVEPKFKHTNYLTSALLVAIDTRDVSFEDGDFVSHPTEFDKGSRNTDTIMQVIYDNVHNRVFMVSIPRDMGVDIVEDCMVHHGKINLVYDIAEKKNCPGGGEAMLNKAVAMVTGVEVHYYAFVTFDAFKEAINTFGTKNDEGEVGLELYNPKAFREAYPKDTGGWQNVYFPKGDLFLDSNETLQYVRSRKYTTDFSRIRRQQIFIEAFKDSVYKSNIFLSPQKLLHMLTVFNEESIVTIPSLNEIRAGIELLDAYEDIQIYHIYLDPEIGGHEVYVDKQPNGRTGGIYYMTPTAWRKYPGDEFHEIRALINNIMIYPEVYEESAKVFVYSSSYLSGKPKFTNQTYAQFTEQHFPITIEESNYIGKTDFADEILILDYSDGKYQNTLDLLSSQLNARILPGGKAPHIQINKEDIAIIIND